MGSDEPETLSIPSMLREQYKREGAKPHTAFASNHNPKRKRGICREEISPEFAVAAGNLSLCIASLSVLCFGDVLYNF